MVRLNRLWGELSEAIRIVKLRDAGGSVNSYV
jgi:hypothetical protein